MVTIDNDSEEDIIFIKVHYYIAQVFHWLNKINIHVPTLTKKNIVHYSLLQFIILQNYGTMELWFTMENYGTMEKNYGTMDKTIVL